MQVLCSTWIQTFHVIISPVIFVDDVSELCSDVYARDLLRTTTTRMTVLMLVDPSHDALELNHAHSSTICALNGKLVHLF